MTRLFYDLWGKRFWSAVLDEQDLELEARELPPGPRTLFLRLMAKGNILLNALADIHALPDDALVRQVALPILVAFRTDLLERRLVADDPRHQDTETLMNILERGRKILDDITTKAHAEGEALTLGGVLARRLGRPLTEAEQHSLGAWVASTDIDHAIDEVFELGDSDEAAQWLERLVAD